MALLTTRATAAIRNARRIARLHALSDIGAVRAGGFHGIERLLLIVIALMPVGAAGTELVGVWRAQTIARADILLLSIAAVVIVRTPRI